MNNLLKKINVKRIVCVLFSILFFVNLCACNVGSLKKTSNIQYNNKKIIRVGVYESFSGENATVGQQELYGVRYANEKYNSVEIAGEQYKIELIEVDNKTDKNSIEDTARKMLNEKVAFVIGGFDSNLSIKASEIFEKAGVPFIVPCNGNPELNNGKSFCYKLSPDDTFLATVMANYIKNDGANNVAVILENENIDNTLIMKYFERACKSLDLNIIDNLKCSFYDSSFNNMYLDVEEKKTEYIFVPCSIKNSPYIVRAARDNGINCNILSNSIWDIDETIKKAGNACEGLSYTTYFDSNNIITNAAQSFLYGDNVDKGFANYLIANGQSENVTSVHALGYDAYMAVYYAMQNAMSTKIEDVKASLDDVTFEGVTGVVSFDENGDRIQKKIIFKNIKNGMPIYREVVSVD